MRLLYAHRPTGSADEGAFAWPAAVPRGAPLRYQEAGPVWWDPRRCALPG